MPLKCAKDAVLGALGAATVLLAGAAQAAAVPGQGTWETTLLGRDIDGHAVGATSRRAVFLYDTTLDITWLRDANYARTSDSDGKMDWYQANTWADTLTVGSYSGWRLPTMIDTGPPGPDWGYDGTTDAGFYVQTKSGDPTKYEAGQTVYSEMAHLWYVTLGNLGDCSPPHCVVPGTGLTNTGSFKDLIQRGVGIWWWSGLYDSFTPPGSFGPYAWHFDMDDGDQTITLARNELLAMAVRPGDVAAVVPEPQTYALLMFGLAGLAVAVRRRQAVRT